MAAHSRTALIAQNDKWLSSNENRDIIVTTEKEFNNTMSELQRLASLRDLLQSIAERKEESDISYLQFWSLIYDNPNNITKALGYDKRISPYYIKSGLSFGGTCFPRDTWAFINMSEKIGLDAVHIKATQKINELQNKYLIDKVSKFKGKRIGIFGLSFKPNTSVTSESAGNILYEFLKQNEYEVYGCDELVDTDFNLNSFGDFINQSDVLVLVHTNKEIIQKYSEILKNKILINPWNIEI
jgi:UDP-glucose 6-dehydrogenase